MAIHSVRLPDVGEGVAEAELVEWHVKVGDLVREDDTLAAVMTDKATVEIPAPRAGKVVWIAGQPGDKLAVGSDLVRLEVEGATVRLVTPPQGNQEMRHRVDYTVSVDGAVVDQGTRFVPPGRPLVIEKGAP